MSEVNRLVAEVVEEVEWITVDYGGSWGVMCYCPICEQDKKDGHGDDCNMDRLVKALGGDTNGVPETETQAEK